MKNEGNTSVSLAYMKFAGSAVSINQVLSAINRYLY